MSKYVHVGSGEYIYVCGCMCFNRESCSCSRLYSCIYVCVCARVRVRVCARVHVCARVRVHVCVCVRVYQQGELEANELLETKFICLYAGVRVWINMCGCLGGFTG